MNVIFALLLAWSVGHDLASVTKARVMRLEVVEMVSAILKGSMMGPGEGWFHPSQSKYAWKWLASRFDKNDDGSVDFDEFKGSGEFYDRLDRDRDGVIKAEDFDWSDDAAYLKAIAPYNQLFRRFDLDSNGRLSREEWLALFDRAANGQGDLAPEEFRGILGPPPAPRQRKNPPMRFPGPPSDAPTPMILLKGLVQGEVGSPFEGPRVGQVAPDFTLKTRDKKGRITLSGYRGKPVVLVFGSFT